MTDIAKERKLCTGCAACAQVCKQSAITMRADCEGFLYPEIDNEKCTNCGLCVKTCPINVVFDNDGCDKDTLDRSAINYFACFSKDEDIRKDSSSGGIFSLLAQSVLSQGGVVFGAEFDEHFRVRHNYIETADRLDALRRSKYVQSEIGTTYLKAKNFLNDGKRVLFCGTPCQIAGLKSFLRKEYENLLSCDMACHGVPSPLIWDMYLDFMKGKYNSEITAISFRDKSTGWNNSSMRIDFGNGRQYKEKVKSETYFIGFGKSIFNRKSCFECKFRIQNTKADITLADFWGIEKLKDRDFEGNKGVSLVITHTKKGADELLFLKDKICIKERSIEEALAKNPRLISSCSLPSGRESFFNNLEAGFSFDKLRKKYMDNFSIKYRIKRFIKLLISPELIKVIRGFIKK